MKRSLAATLAAAACLPAWAHEGHGAAPVHWHATDTAGFLMVAVLAALALWLGRGE